MEIICNELFENCSADINGRAFYGCSFGDVEMLWDGVSDTSFTDCVIQGPIKMTAKTYTRMMRGVPPTPVKYTIELQWDSEVRLWILSSPDIHGLAGEARSIADAIIEHRGCTANKISAFRGNDMLAI